MLEEKRPLTFKISETGYAEALKQNPQQKPHKNSGRRKKRRRKVSEMSDAETRTNGESGVQSRNDVTPAGGEKQAKAREMLRRNGVAVGHASLRGLGWCAQGMVSGFGAILGAAAGFGALNYFKLNPFTR